MKFSTSRVKLGSIAAAIVMCLTATVPPLALTWLTQVRSDAMDVEARLFCVRRVQELLIDAETGQRGYVITGKEEFLEPYHAALTALPGELKRLPQLYVDAPPRESELVAAIRRNAQHRLVGLTETVEMRRIAGFDVVQPIISTATGKHYADAVRAAAAELGELETQREQALNDDLQLRIRGAMLFSVVSTALTLMLLAYLARLMRRTARSEARAAAEAQHTSQALERGFLALQQRNEEISRLGEMSRLLQTEMSLVEALEITGGFCERLLPGTSGAIYLARPPGEPLELAARWGPNAPGAAAVEPTLCWGLRRAQPHRHGGGGLRCRHCIASVDDGRLRACLPLVAQGDTLGLMHLCVPAAAADDDGSTQDKQLELAQTVSEQVALSLSNAKLRQVLREQSIKDPLTGLYNRRFMEETLRKEVSRASRSGRPLSLLVIDLDHFKKVNDSHGHAAGDAVLRAVARQIGLKVRASDVACRYGGEEFVLILPDCSKSDALAKAQQLRRCVRELNIVEGAVVLRITASFGVASTPDDGQDPTQLFEAADRAVYAAKRSGRDRVVVSGEAPAEVEAVAGSVAAAPP